MKKLKILLISLLISSVLMIQTGCYGSFTLTNKVYDWNGGLGDNIVVEVVFLALLVIPVYEVTMVVDGLLLNTIEFFTGSNPIASKGELPEDGIVNYKDHTYRITTIDDGFSIEILDGKYCGQIVDVVKNVDDNGWVLENNGRRILLPGV